MVLHAALACELFSFGGGGPPLNPHSLLRMVGVVAVMALVALPSAGYIHFPPPTMQKMCKISTNIRVLSVKKHDKEKGIFVYEVAETLKGENKKGVSFRHAIPKDTAESKPRF